MAPLYAARVSDLGPGDFAQLECVCEHAMLLTPQMLATAGARPDQKVLDLQSRMRCREWMRGDALSCRSGGVRTLRERRAVGVAGGSECAPTGGRGQGSVLACEHDREDAGRLRWIGWIFRAELHRRVVIDPMQAKEQRQRCR